MSKGFFIAWAVVAENAPSPSIGRTSSVLDPSANGRRARNYSRPMTRPGELANAWLAAGFSDVDETALSIRMDKDRPNAEYVATLGDSARARLRDAVRSAY